jgi:hypothetical protein
MNNKRCLIVLSVVILFPLFASGELKEDREYKLLTIRENLLNESGKNDTNYFAECGDVFTLLKSNSDTFLVRFNKVHASKKNKSELTLYTMLPVSHVKIGVNYKIPKQSLRYFDCAENDGFAFSILAVPLKVIPGVQNKTEFTVLPGGTFDGFIGYRKSQLIIGGAAGLGAIATSKLNDNKISSTLGVNVCGGLIWEPIKTSKLGLGILAGSDWATDSDYAYSGKVWFCISTGYTFLR